LPVKRREAEGDNDPVTQKTVHAEMAGAILSIACAAGARFDAGQELLVMESMKMEIPIVADDAGIVVQIFVAEGDSVTQGQKLIVLES
jgi:acetyl-CoA carboxylase biotin carboxyl carrier protein